MKARPRNNRPAVGVAAFEAIFSTQLTVDVLSHNVPRGACMIFGADSNITPIANTSAASSRSELVMLPDGLSSVMISADRE